MSAHWQIAGLALSVTAVALQLALYIRLKRMRRVMIETLGEEIVKRIEERMR